MNTKDLIYLGVSPHGDGLAEARVFIKAFIADGGDGARLSEEILAIVARPEAFFDDPRRAALARALHRAAFTPRAEPAPWRQWGDSIEPQAVQQMANACALPVAVAGAAQTDLVEVLGRFDPKLVKMCPAGEKAED